METPRYIYIYIYDCLGNVFCPKSKDHWLSGITDKVIHKCIFVYSKRTNENRNVKMKAPFDNCI